MRIDKSAMDLLFCFFVQAEDGIRGYKVTGVQTCALPILRAALGEAVALATEANRYLDQQGPWFEIKKDRAEASRTIYTALKAIDSLKVLFAPFLPFTSEQLHQCLGYDGALFGTQRVETYPDEKLGQHTGLTYDPAGATGRWAPSELKPGQPLRQPAPLFKKLDEKVVEEER